MIGTGLFDHSYISVLEIRVWLTKLIRMSIILEKGSSNFSWINLKTCIFSAHDKCKKTQMNPQTSAFYLIQLDCNVVRNLDIDARLLDHYLSNNWFVR